MGDPRVFVDFAEEVLAIDQLQPSSEQPAEFESKAYEVLLLRLCHVADDLGLDAARAATETLIDAIPRAGARDDELVLTGID